MLDYVRSLLMLTGINTLIRQLVPRRYVIESGPATRVPEIHRKRLGWIYISSLGDCTCNSQQKGCPSNSTF